MWTRRCPFRATLLSLVLALTSTEFANGDETSSRLDIQMKLVSDGTNKNARISDITICITLPEDQGMDPTEKYLMTLTNSMATTIREDSVSNLRNPEHICFSYHGNFSEFNMEELVDITVYYETVSDEEDGREQSILLQENVKFLVPKVAAVNGQHILVQWNNPYAQMFSISDDTNESFPILCKSKICQFLFGNPNHQRYMHLEVQSDNKIQIHQTVKIEIDMVQGGPPFDSKPKLNFIRQSISLTDGSPFISVEIEAKDLDPVECAAINIMYPNAQGNGTLQQTNELCTGWDGSKLEIQIPNAEIPSRIEDITMIIFATDAFSINDTNNDIMNAIKDISEVKFTTSGFDTSIAIVGSSSGDNNAFLRVKVGSGEEDVSVGDETCEAGNTCYYPYMEQDIKERTKSIDIGGGKTITQFDNSTIPVINLDELSEVKLLDEKSLDIAINDNAVGNTVKVLIFNPKDNSNDKGELECFDESIKDTINCKLQLDLDMTDMDQLNMVVILVNPENKVLESSLVVFEYLNLKVETFTDSMLKVTWKGSSGDLYLLDIDPVPMSYKIINTMCTSHLENCLAFFTGIEAKSGYTLSVKKEGSITKIVQTLTDVSDQPPEEVPMSKVIDSNQFTKVEVDISQLDLLSHVEVSVTRLSNIDTANQTILATQKIDDGNVYSSKFSINPEDDNAFNDETELLLLGYDKDDKIIATSYLSYQYTDILVELASIGNNPGSEGWSIRMVPLTEDQEMYIGDSSCKYGETCYVIEPDTLQICVDGVGKKDTHFQQCDETQEPSKFQGINEVTKMILTNEKYLEVGAEFNPSKDTVEILLYDPNTSNIAKDAQECIEMERKSDCTVELKSSVPEELLIFNVLIVVLDTNQRVLESLSKSFEDLKLNAEVLTSDILEAKWHHGVNTDNYLVHLASNTQSLINDMKSTCTYNDTCTALFSHVEANEYTFTIEKEGDSVTKVAKTFTVSGEGDKPAEMAVSNVIDSDGCTKLTLKKSSLPASLEDIGVSITSIDDSENYIQTFVPATKIFETKDNIVYSIPFVFDSINKRKDKDITEMVLVGLDTNEEIVASAELSFHYQELSTKISAVGAALNNDTHSLRVVLAEDESLQDSPKNCTVTKPCYIIEPNSTIPVCAKQDDGSELLLCNDGSTEFEDLSDDNVKVDISTDGHVDVSATLSDMDDLVLEVVLYDDKFPHVILSNDNGYNCTKNQIRGNKYSCSQEAQLTKDIQYVWVLVVAIRSTDNTVVQSTKIHKPINVHDTTTEVWVIVVSSIGAIFGAIFILFAILVTWKKMGSKKEEKKNNSQVADTRSEDKEQHGDDLHMNHLRSEHPSMHGAAHENPAFAHNRTNTTNNIQQNSYTEPYSSDNVPNRLSRSPEYPRTNHQNPYARSSNPPIRNDQFRCPQPIPAGNAYRRPLNPAYPTAYSPQMRAKEPIYDRLSKDNATAKALERVPIGPIPRVTAHPNRVKQHIPPHGNWDVEI